MLTCVLAVVASSVIRDADTSAMTVVSIIEGLGVPQLGMAAPAVHALFVLERGPKDPDEFPVDVVVLHDGRELARDRQVARFGGARLNRYHVNLSGMPLDRAGTRRVALFHDGRELGGWGFPITLVAPQSA